MVWSIGLPECIKFRIPKIVLRTGTKYRDREKPSKNKRCKLIKIDIYQKHVQLPSKTILQAQHLEHSKA